MTEDAFSGRYVDTFEPGMYHSAATGQLLFSSEAKFHSGTGWASFYEPISPDAVVLKTDSSMSLKRPRVRRRPSSDRPPLLHQLRCADIRAGGW